MLQKMDSEDPAVRLTKLQVNSNPESAVQNDQIANVYENKDVDEINKNQSVSKGAGRLILR